MLFPEDYKFMTSRIPINIKSKLYNESTLITINIAGNVWRNVKKLFFW